MKIDLEIKTGRISKLNLIEYTRSGYIPVFICRFMNPLVKCYENSILHFPEAAPSAELLHSSKSGKIDWEEYTERYYNELLSRKFKVDEFIDKLYKLTVNNPEVKARGVVLLCYCHDRNKCHRSLLANLINSLDLLTDKIIELYV